MKNVYTGKRSADGSVTICRVIDSDITTGAATVYNRETGKIEVLEWKDHCTLNSNIKRLAEDTEHEHEAAFLKAVTIWSAHEICEEELAELASLSEEEEEERDAITAANATAINSVFMAACIRKINEVARNDFDSASVLLSALNDLAGTKLGWLSKRVVVFRNPDGSVAEKYAHCEDAASFYS